MGVSPDAVLALAWALVLGAFAGSKRVCFASQAQGRNGYLNKHAVGSFANMVVLAINLSLSEPVSSVLQSTHARLLESLPHQHVTIPEIHHQLGFKGNDRLFNTCLFANLKTAAVDTHATLHHTRLPPNCLSHHIATDYDIAVNVRAWGGNLILDLAQRLLSPDQAANVCHAFSHALRTLIASPHQYIATLDLFTERDYALAQAWSKNFTGYLEERGNATIHDLVARKVSEMPDSPAVMAADGRLTYSQVDYYADAFANHLAALGACPKDVIPVVLEKSRWVPVVLLAVLKLGAIFVPIDSQNLGLLHVVLSAISCDLGVVFRTAAADLGSPFTRTVAVHDALFSSLTGQATIARSRPTPTDTACVLFTSSKESKGIAFTHTALSIAFLAQGPAAKIAPHTRVMSVSSFDSDVSLSAIFTTLVHGGCVCIPSSSYRVGDLEKDMGEMRVNWIYLTPFLLRRLTPTNLPDLEVVCTHTRALDQDTRHRWLDRVIVLLAYGAPDICPLAISFLQVTESYHLNSIARPFAGYFWIVDAEDHHRTMPIGALGELVVEGPTLGTDLPKSIRNGHDDGRDTFISAATDNGSRRYFRTGHKVRYTEQGLIELVSSNREDFELDGHLVNPLEVEMYLRRCLGRGTDVMVEAIAFGGPAPGLELAVFIELGDKVFEGPEQLDRLSPATRGRLYIARQLIENGMRKKVPPYIIPSIFVPVKQFPVTTSFKINRRRAQKLIAGLSKDELLNLATVSEDEAVRAVDLKPFPLTEAKQKLRTIWARVLAIEESQIDAADGFYDVGGNEVLAAKLMVACRQAGVIISMPNVLQNTRLADLCASMTYAQQDKDAASPAEPESRHERMAAVDEWTMKNVLAPKVGVDESDILDAAEASAAQILSLEAGMRKGHADLSHFVFDFAQSPDLKHLESACRRLLTMHPILRTAFVPFKHTVYQVVLTAHIVEFKHVSCPNWRLAKLVDKTMEKDYAQAVQWGKPITRFTLLDSGKRSTLVIRLSKAQYDDHSAALLVKDLKMVYDASRDSLFRSTHCQFVHSVMMASRAPAVHYWRSLLEGASMTQVVAHTRPAPLTTNLKTLHERLWVAPLSSLGIAFEVVLKAAWAVVLAHHASTSDVVFGEWIDGRQVCLPGGQSVASVLGPASHVIPVRVRFPDNAITPIGLLMFVHTQRITSIPHENMGLLELVQSCTGWPRWTRFSTIVRHQSAEARIVPSHPRKFQIGSAACKFQVIESKAHDLPDMLLESTMRDSGKIELGLTICQDRVPTALAADFLQMLCRTLSLLTSVNINHPLIPAGFQLRAMRRTIPLVPKSDTPTDSHDANTTPREVKAPGFSAALQRHNFAHLLPPDQAQKLQTLIMTAWVTILDPRAYGVADDRLFEIPFYHLWGTLVPASQFASYYMRTLPDLELPRLDCNTMISMEDIIDHPTMLDQFRFVLTKMRGIPPKDATTPLTATKLTNPPDDSSPSIGQGLKRLANNIRTPSSTRMKKGLAPAPLTIPTSTGPPGDRWSAESLSTEHSGAESSSPAMASSSPLTPETLGSIRGRNRLTPLREESEEDVSVMPAGAGRGPCHCPRGHAPQGSSASSAPSMTSSSSVSISSRINTTSNNNNNYDLVERDTANTTTAGRLTEPPPTPQTLPSQQRLAVAEDDIVSPLSSLGLISPKTVRFGNLNASLERRA